MPRPVQASEERDLDLVCTECGDVLVDVAAPGAPVMWRCLNTGCARCSLLPMGHPVPDLDGVSVGFEI